jgi:putative nucleotidyltransferase with HDIG domain
VAKGQVQGVLEIFNRTPLKPSAEWREFLEALAGQAAIAIDNLSLFQDLQESNYELALAYDATIEGWSHALDLRDRETEGHTLRVTEMTIKLAQSMGIPESEMVHLRRGALLHDIGKMGVPDRILHKGGPLNAADWDVMRKHPEYAFGMLAPITYLRKAIDIPYCHHERWDGAGYPRGLSGELIPLGARIFAVVDVWDALTSDRPYRTAWPAKKALDYIRLQSGKHFDPRVVESFLRQISKD